MIFRLFIDKECTEEIIANVHERTPLIDKIEDMVLQENTADQITGYLNDEIALLKTEKTECFTAENEKIFAVYENGKKYLIRKRLYELEELLSDNFVKISRSSIANWNRISKFKVQLSGAVDAVFTSGHTECISRRCFADLKRRYKL